MTSPSRVVVVGAGAIGAATGALLHEAGVAVVLVARGENGRVIAADGVDLRLPDGARRIRVPVLSLAEAAPTPSDLVLLATMGHHTAAAVAHLDPAVPVASFQNGLEPIEVLVRRGHPTLPTVVWFSAERRAPGQIALGGVPVPGAFLVGGTHPWVPWLVDRLVAAGFRAEVEPDVLPWIRAKLLHNLGGIAAALCDAPPADVTGAARDEAIAVWRASGDRFVDPARLDARIGPIHSVPVDGRLRVGGSTRGALSRGEPLETEVLHRGIVAEGRRLGIPTPVNEGLIRLSVRAAAEGWAPGSLSADELRVLVG